MFAHCAIEAFTDERLLRAARRIFIINDNIFYKISNDLNLTQTVAIVYIYK